jgi:hypothetical protein
LPGPRGRPTDGSTGKARETNPSLHRSPHGPIRVRMEAGPSPHPLPPQHSHGSR